jgi:hypothetical protein
MYQYDAAFTNEQGHTLIAGPGNEELKGGAGNDTFVAGPGQDTMIGGGGTDTIQDSGVSSYTLTNSLLTGSGTATLTGIQNAVLTGSASGTGTTFDLSNWTGKATVNGGVGVNTLVVHRDVNFTLTNSTLTLSDGTVITLQNIQKVDFQGGIGNNVFDLSGWTGTAKIDGGPAGQDTVIVNRPDTYVLTDSSPPAFTMTATNTGGSFQLANITSVAGGTGSVFDVRGYTGTVTLNAVNGANPVSKARGANFSTFEGVAGLSTLGSLTDLGTSVATNYIVSVNWGDNQTSAGSTSPSGSTIFAQGSHPYAEERTNPYTVTTTISQGSAFSVIVSSSATVTDSQLTSVVVNNISPVEGATFNGTVATFVDPGGSEPVGDYTATLDWGDKSGTAVGTIIDNGNGHFTVTGTHTYDEGNYTVKVTLTHDQLSAVTAIGSAVVSDAALQAAGSAGFTVQQGIAFNRQLATFTDGNPAAPLGDFTATVNWGDGSTPTTGSITQPGGVGTTFVVNGTHDYGISGSETVTVTITDVGGQKAMTSVTPLTVQPSIIVLNPSAAGALILSGSSSLTVTGAVVVDSNSATALTATGSSHVTAGSILVVGGVSAPVGALNVTPAIGVPPIPDPLAWLTAPGTGTSQTAVNLTGGSKTIDPGVYSQISVSGNGTTLNMNPGVYVITGGGFTVSNSANVSGAGVVIYNAGSNFPSAGGTFGAVVLGSSGTISLSAPTSGPYTGFPLIFQARDNTQTLSLNAQSAVGLNGTIYAPAALLSLGAGSQLHSPVIVNTLSVSGHGGSPLTAAGFTLAPDGDTLGTRDNLYVYVNDPDGQFTADERSRLTDAVGRLNAALAPTGVSVTQVGDAGSANVVVDTGVTSASGGAADGVLGSFSIHATLREITLVQGWNWYTGADSGQVRPDQYDFEAVLLHEFGHALGLDHSDNPNSVMYETLPTGITRRSITPADFQTTDQPAAEPDLLPVLHGVTILPPQAAAPTPLTVDPSATDRGANLIVTEQESLGVAGLPKGPIQTGSGRILAGTDSSMPAPMLLLLDPSDSTNSLLAGGPAPVDPHIGLTVRLLSDAGPAGDPSNWSSDQFEAWLLGGSLLSSPGLVL